MGGLPNEPIPDPHVLKTEGSQIVDHRLSTSCGVVERAALVMTLLTGVNR